MDAAEEAKVGRDTAIDDYQWLRGVLKKADPDTNSVGWCRQSGPN